MKKIVAIMLIAALSLSACGGTSAVASTGQSSSTAPAITAPPDAEAEVTDEAGELIKGKSLDKIGYRCEAPSGIEIAKDIFLRAKSFTGDNYSDMGVNEILGEDAYTLISVRFYGPHSLGSDMLYFMYLQAFSTADTDEKNFIEIGEETYTFGDLQPYLVFKTDDICVYDVYKLTGDDDLQTKINKWVDIHNGMVKNCVNATAEDREKYSIIMTEEDFVTYEDYNYLHDIAEYYTANIGEMIVKKQTENPQDYPPYFGIDEVDPSLSSSTESVNADFYEKYPNGRFVIRVVDSQNVPLINTRVIANLDYPEYHEMYRGTITNLDGEGTLAVPQDSTQQFISGEYEFKVIQYLPDGSSREEIVKETLTAENTYPVFNLTPMSWVVDPELFNNYKDKIVVKLLQNGEPLKNTWSVMRKAGVPHPDSGGGTPKLGRSEGYTDAEGKVYFFNVPAGSYDISFHADNMYQMGYMTIEVEGGKTQEFSFEISK